MRGPRQQQCRATSERGSQQCQHMHSPAAGALCSGSMLSTLVQRYMAVLSQLVRYRLSQQHHTVELCVRVWLLPDIAALCRQTCVHVCCSPAAENVSETKCSLDFATRARKVELGAAPSAAAARAVPELSSPIGSGFTGRDSPVGAAGRGSQGGVGGSSGSTSAASSPRAGSRYSGTGTSSTANELRQALSRRSQLNTAPSAREEKQQ